MRPESVPEGAVLLEAVINGKKCPYWELGQKKDGKIVGEVRWWRSDGQLWGFENHDSSGVMHGLKESYHPNGELAQRTPFERGKAHGVWWGCRCSEPSDETWRLVMSSVLVAKEQNPVWRNEITYQAGQQVGGYRFFLRDGRPCNGVGIPAGVPAPELGPVLERFDSEYASLGLKDRIRLVNDCCKEIRRLAREGAWLVSSTRIQVIKPAAEETIRAIEDEYGALPASYRRFLSEVGQLAPLTSPPASILKDTQGCREVIEGMYLNDDGSFPEGERSVSAWRDLDVNDAAWLPKEHRSGRFLRVCGGQMDGLVLALDHRGPDGEAPFFMLYHDDPHFHLFAKSTEEFIRNLLRKHVLEEIEDVSRLWGSRA